MSVITVTRTVEQWGVFEIALAAETAGNPFTDVQFSATFQLAHRSVIVDGFYDGDNTFCIRFMPDAPGEWRFETTSDCPALHGAQGSFVCVPPAEDNHGPVSVRDTYHFAYADGTPFYQVGTTCYAWTHQSDALQEETLRTLAAAPFNKLRMCVFPKHYTYNRREPACFPYERGEDGNWDFTRFNPTFFQRFERRVADLLALGIEADIILFHPYDRWGFAAMSAEHDERYLRYVTARLSAYRNIWWSMANEFDFMKDKSMQDWDRIFRIVQESDHAGHLRSIHNGVVLYDHAKPWVTHASIQHSDLLQVRHWRDTYRKPVVVDECCYEGNVPEVWGNITARALVHRFWLGTVRGGYVGHGETYLHPEDILWWSHGGVLHGESPARLAFLQKVLADGSAKGLDPLPPAWDQVGCSKGDAYYLYYYGEHQPAKRRYTLPEHRQYRAEVIDTWEMTITPVAGLFSGACEVPLPGKPFQAVRFVAVSDE